MIGENFIFIHIPKTAGSSIQHHLQNYSDDVISELKGQEGEWINPEGILEVFELQNEFGSKHARLKDYYEKWDENKRGDIDNYFKFCVVRNPWDRAISFFWYNNLIDLCFHKKDFDKNKFIEQTNFEDCVSFCSHEDKVKMDYFIKYERLQRDFDFVCDRLSIPHCRLKNLNAVAQRDGVFYKGKKIHYRDLYDSEMIQHVKKTYAEDIDRFGYTF